jgi:hypothetical protein
MTRDESKKFVAQQVLFGLSRSHYVNYIGPRIGITPFEWQMNVLNSSHKRKHINGTRQCGKSTIVSSIPCHTAKYFPKSLSIILAPTEKQATEDILKVKDFIAADPSYPEIKRDSQDEIALENKSRIIIIPATEKSARGYSMPRVIILDEASRIPDIVYKSGVIPMLTNNPECEVLEISTPNGKQGFFYDSSSSKWYERYEIRSPWQVDPGDSFNLIEYMTEDEYREMMAARGIQSWFSPRHFNLNEQLENLEKMGMMQYRQEYCCEFVEQEDMVFSYEDLDRAFGRDNRIAGLDADLMDFGTAPITGLEEMLA